MKSALQIQLDNTYEVLRVAYTKKREEAAVHKLPARPVNPSLKELPSNLVQQSANWDLSWFNHYE